ncbi:MAG: hypothetical protein WKG00_24615 [Polyangiaceae bacterium]
MGRSDDEWVDPVIEVYKRDVDVTLLQSHLRKTPTERLEALQSMHELVEELRRGVAARRRGP